MNNIDKSNTKLYLDNKLFIENFILYNIYSNI
jgi:hypothetical protein